jgi:hypothetical protein
MKHGFRLLIVSLSLCPVWNCGDRFMGCAVTRPAFELPDAHKNSFAGDRVAVAAGAGRGARGSRSGRWQRETSAMAAKTATCSRWSATAFRALRYACFFPSAAR